MSGISQTNASNSAAADGVTTVFSFTFFVYSEDHIKVYSVLNDVLTEITTGFTKSINSSYIGGSVTFSAAPAAALGDILVRREVPNTQTTEFADLTRYKETAIEQALNTIVMQIQQIKADIDRSLKYNETSDTTDTTVETPVDGSLLACSGVTGRVVPVTLASLSLSESAAVISGAMSTVIEATTLSAARTAMGCETAGAAAAVLAACLELTGGTMSGDITLASTPTRDSNDLVSASTAYADRAAGLLGFVSGLVPSLISGTSTTASLTVSAGACTDSTGAYTLKLASPQAWAVSNGNAANGYQGGATLPNSSTIHMFLCRGTSGTCTFAHNGLTPTPPSGYNTLGYRRIFSLRTDASGNPIAGTFSEIEGGGLICWYSAVITDFNSNTLGSAARTLYALTVPGDIIVRPIARVGTTGTEGVIITSPSEPDTAPSNHSAGTSPGFDLYGGAGGTGEFTPYVTTDTSRQIGARAYTGTTNTLSIFTRGFVDFRR